MSEQNSTLSINEVLLDEAASKLIGNDEVTEFLNAFKKAEEEHINNFLGKDNFNLRSAALCAEAYSVAELMLTIIKESNKEVN